MGYKGLSCLHSLIKDQKHYLITAIVSSGDKAVKNDYYKEINDLCKQHNICFYHRSKYTANALDIIIAISWRWIIKTNQGIVVIVFHDSLLPAYRGFAPLVSSLINGEKKLGVTALFASAEYDKGDIIMQQHINVEYPLKIENAIEKISYCYNSILKRLISSIESDSVLTSFAQDEKMATYSLWLDEKDYIIKWHHSAEIIKRFIDSVGYPYNGATAFLNGEKIKICEAEAEGDVVIENRVPGKVIFMKEQYPVVVCGTGLLKIIKAENEKGQSIFPLKNFRSRFTYDI